MRLYNLLVLGMLAGSQALFGSSLQPAGYDAGLGYFVDGALALPGQSQFVSAAPGATAVYSGCLVSTGTTAACGSSYATAGQLGNQASMHDSNPTSIPGLYEGLDAFSWSRDILTISGPSGSGTYMLIPTITIHGTSTWNGATAPGAQQVGVGAVEWDPDGTRYPDQNFDATLYGSNGSTFSQTVQLQGVPFQPGTPFDFQVGFAVTARVFQPSTGATSTDVNADFLSTMRITGLSVIDPSGNTVGSFSIQSASGAIYGPNGVSTVPEPATLPLVIAGIIGILMFGKNSYLNNAWNRQPK